MKKSMLFGIILLSLLIAAKSQCEQTTDTVDVKATLWRYTKTVISAKAMLEEAYDTKEYLFVIAAAKYLGYANNNLEKLQGKIDPKMFEDAEKILGVLVQVTNAGSEPSMVDLTAFMIAGVNIDVFVEKIFASKKNKGSDK